MIIFASTEKPCKKTAHLRYCVCEDFEHGTVRSKTSLRVLSESSKVSIGESVTFVCDANYTLEGKECLTCVGGCVWSDHWPRCKRTVKSTNHDAGALNTDFS